MQGGAFAASFLLHAGVIAVLSLTFTLGNRPEFRDVPQVIAIDLVAIGEETVIKPEVKEEVAEDTPPAPPVLQPQEAEVEEEPEETAALPEEVIPQEAPKTDEPKPEETPPPPEPEETKEKLKEEEEPQKIDERSALDAFAKMIDRSKEPAKTKLSAEEEFFATFGGEKPSGQTQDSRDQAISLVDAARNQVQRCWAPPLGARDAASMRLSVSVLLGPDGEVIGAPTLDPADQRRMKRSNETVFRVFAESAIRAIQQCAPFELPKSRYGEWRSLRLNFDPSQMLN